MSSPPPDRREALGVPILPDTAHETIQRCVMDILEQRHGGVLFSEGQWWSYTTIGAWVAMLEEEIWAEVQALNGLDTLEGAVDDKPGKPIRVTAGMCESVCALARARFRDDRAFINQSQGFVTPKGLWTCTAADGWTCRAPRPEDRVRRFVPVDPVMHVAPALWVAALHRMWGHEEDFGERCAFIHEWIGATLSGEVTRYQVAPILVGDGENGKSVIIDVVAGMFPDDLRCSVTPDELENNRFASSRLVGKALNCVAEIPGGELLTSARIKAIIDGSEQSAERKNKDGFEFRPTAGHIFSANSLPHVKDLTHGFWRRWCPLSCTAPKLSKEEKRPRFAAEILEHELAQILGYAMTYYEQMVMERRAYTEVPSAVEIRETWRGDSDNVQQWLSDETDADARRAGGAGASTEIGRLYAAYKRYASETGTKSVSLRTFGARLQALGFPAERNRTARTRALTLTSEVMAKLANEERHGGGWWQ